MLIFIDIIIKQLMQNSVLNSQYVTITLSDVLPIRIWTIIPVIQHCLQLNSFLKVHVSILTNFWVDNQFFIKVTDQQKVDNIFRSLPGHLQDWVDSHYLFLRSLKRVKVAVTPSLGDPPTEMADQIPWKGSLGRLHQSLVPWCLLKKIHTDAKDIVCREIKANRLTPQGHVQSW